MVYFLLGPIPISQVHIYIETIQVPGPLTAEMEASQAERRRAHRAQRKQHEKKEREAQQLLMQEEEEKRRFALLSDREKVGPLIIA